MDDCELLSLYDAFERLFSNELPGIRETTAIWHVLKPPQVSSLVSIPLIQTDQMTTGDTFAHHYNTHNIHTITFGELRAVVSQVGEQLIDDLRHLESFQSTWETSNLPMDYMLCNSQIQSNTVVAIFMPPGIDRIVTQIACMKLHLAFLPLDRQLSAGRIVQIIEKISPVVAILSLEYYEAIFNSQDISEANLDGSSEQGSGPFFADKLETLKPVFETVPIRIYHKRLLTRLNRVTKHKDGQQTDRDRNIKTNLNSYFFELVKDPVVVVFFTSGSTSSGPKVVRLRNSQLVNRLTWQWKTNVELDENADWRVTDHGSRTVNREIALASTACVFVDAFTELFGSLFAGCPVVVPGSAHCTSEVCVSDVRILCNLVSAFGITRLTTVPNQLNIWMHQLRMMNPKEQTDKMISLNTVVVSGDVLLPESACTFFRLFRGHKLRLLNFYGNTEMAGDVTAAVFNDYNDVLKATKHVVDPNNQGGSVSERVSFIATGRPIFNTTVYIVKKKDGYSNNTVNGLSFPDKDEHMNFTNEKLRRRSLLRCDLSVIGSNSVIANLESLGYELCEKGQVGEVAISGVPVNGLCNTSDCPIASQNSKRMPNKMISNSTCVEGHQSHHCSINFPGDLGFICPDDNQLYICGRSDEVVKINAVGFLASDVDRIILRIKEACLRRPQQTQPVESKLISIHESVTLPVQHPVNKSRQIACFYVVNPKRLSLCAPTLTYPVLVEPIGQERSDYRRPLAIINAQPLESDAGFLKPNDLSVAIANYLPVYIRPVFVQVNRIPVMPTSGKVDKQRLIKLYEEKFSASRENGSPSLTNTNGLTKASLTSSGHVTLAKATREQNRRDLARGVIAGILGLQTSELAGAVSRPCDNEDFYLLGGSSLTAVLALESLRQLGFTAHLETFYHTGSIGHILDSLVRSGCPEFPFDRSTDEVDPESHCERNDFTLSNSTGKNQSAVRNEGIRVNVWSERRLAAGDSMQPTRNDLIKLLVNAFDKKDHISHAFHLGRDDLETAASTYLKASETGIVLTATWQMGEQELSAINCDTDLVGVLLSLPTKEMPSLPSSPKLSVLEKYFEFCIPAEPDNVCATANGQTTGLESLTVMMIGVMAPRLREEENQDQSIRARWNRLALEILAQLELRLLREAEYGKYNIVETLNTCETTKEVCTDLGYDLIKTTRMETFALTKNMELDEKYHDHQSYYMTKYLDEL